MWYMLCNIKQSIMGSLCFPLLWINPETLIRPVFVLCFYPSSPSSFLFTCWINLQAYLCADAGLIPLPVIRPPTSWSTCCISSVKVCISLGSLCAPFIYDFSTIYASLSLRRSVLFPLFFLTTIFSVASLTILFIILSTPMISHRYFREENFSGGKITFRRKLRVDFGIQKLPRISEYLDLSNILHSHAWRSSHYVYVWPWTYGRLRLFLTHLNICCCLSGSTKGFPVLLAWIPV